jgi:MATE family multidrug resistance protein
VSPRRHWSELFQLGWPVSATLLVRVTMRTVDILVVGLAVGAVGVAALGIGDAAARIVLMTALGLGAGTIATVSQHLGAGRRHEADVATTQTALLALLFGIPFAVAGWFGARPFFDLLGAEPDVVELGVTYLRIVILTAPFRMLAVMLTRAMQGAGDTRTPMVIRTVGTAVNIGLTIALVPGVGPIPELGVTGAAIGTAVGNTLSALLLVGYLARGGTALGFAAAGLRRFEVGRRILVIGWPQVLERNLFALGIIPLNGIVLTFGTAANAGLQVGQRIMLYALLPSRGVSTAASTRVGNAVGAGTPDEGVDRAVSAVWLAVAVSAPIAALQLAFAEPLARLFVSEPDALAAAATWVRVYSGATLVRAAYGVLRGALQGAGDTKPPLVAGAIGILGFSVGFSWLVGVQLAVGITAVYAGVLLDALVRTAILGWVFRRGEWAERSVVEPAPLRPVEARTG